jgi:hypothetical protein
VTDTDFFAVLDGVIARNKIGQGLDDAIDRVASALSFESPKSKVRAPESAAPRDPSLDRLLDHLVDGDEQYDAALDALIDRGLSADRIATMIEEHRERRRGRRRA